MKFIKYLLFIGSVSIVAMACNANHAENNGSSTPIDSTNMHGTAPATYGGNNPATEQDTSRTNAGDTGTKANNIHNEGTYSHTSTDSMKAKPVGQ